MKHERSDQRPRRLSRRRVLAASVASAVGAAGYAVAEGALPGRAFVYRSLVLHAPDAVIPRVPPGRILDGSFVSAARGGLRTEWSIAFPPGADADAGRLPLLVVLHGVTADHTAAFSDSYLDLDRFLAATVKVGAAPFAIASVDGGNAYYHQRASGEDPGAMVVEEFLPIMAEQGLDIDRLAFMGWSMGGYGALRLSALIGPERVVAATAMSPALWHRFADSAPGAFDDQADFDRFTAFGRQDDLAGIAIRIDCGEQDPFYAATRDYVNGFSTRPAGGFEPGGHDVGYWRRMAPAHLGFIADAFASRGDDAK